MLYHGKPVVISFVVDYSANTQTGDMIVYEIQHTRSGNFSPSVRPGGVEEQQLQDKIINQQSKIWCEHFAQLGEQHFFVDLPPSLRADKRAQREFLGQSQSAAHLNPDHLLCDSKTTIDKLIQFYESHDHQIVLKKSGAIGSGNLFLDPSLADERPSYDQLKAKISQFMKCCEGFVAEAITMFSAFDVRSPLANNARPGAYFRDLVFYNTETGEATYIPVFREIVDMAKSTDNHDPAVTIEEDTYLLQNTPPVLLQKTMDAAKKHPEFHAAKQRNFSAIGKSVFERICRNPQEYIDKAHLKKELFFVEIFHKNDQYQRFFLDQGAQPKTSLLSQLIFLPALIKLVEVAYFIKFLLDPTVPKQKCPPQSINCHPNCAL